MISGYVGGRVDNLMMRVVEILYSLPTLVLVIVLVATLEAPATRLLHRHRPGPACTARRAPLRLPRPHRMAHHGAHHPRPGARAEQQAFVQSSFALGQSHLHILWRHLLPNLSGIILVYLTLTIPAVMLDESFLSFLGLGVQAPQGQLGHARRRGRRPHQPDPFLLVDAAFSRRLMALTLLALNFLGDGLRDALDPRG